MPIPSSAFSSSRPNAAVDPDSERDNDHLSTLVPRPPFPAGASAYHMRLHPQMEPIDLTTSQPLAPGPASSASAAPAGARVDSEESKYDGLVKMIASLAAQMQELKQQHLASAQRLPQAPDSSSQPSSDIGARVQSPASAQASAPQPNVAAAANSPPPLLPQVTVPAASPSPQRLTDLPPALQAFQSPVQPPLAPASQPGPPAPAAPQAGNHSFFFMPPAAPGSHMAVLPPAPQPPVIHQVSLQSTHMPSCAISAGPGTTSVSMPAPNALPSSSSLSSAESILDSLFSPARMPKGLRPVVHAESETAPRTQEALQAMLTAWIDSTLELLRGTPQYEPVSSALWKYATTTLGYVPLVGIHHTVAYHRAAVEAASRSPPLYDPLVHGEIAPHQYLLHIQPHIGKTGIGRRSSKRARPSSGEPISPPSSKQ